MSGSANGNGTAPREWPWWLTKLNSAVGPIVSGRVIVIGARPSCGKTAFMQNLFWHLGRALANTVPASDGRPLILSCWTQRSRPAALMSLASLIEGFDEDLSLRRAWDQLPIGAEARLAERIRLLSGDNLEEEPPNEADDFERFTSPFPILDKAVPTADEIWEALEQHRPHVFLLDFLQRVRQVGRQSVFDAWMAAMAHCAAYAAAGNTVIVTSQLKRKGDGVMDKYRPPFMEDFKGGGAIEESAEVALGLFRPLKVMTPKQERELKAGRVGLEEWQQPGVMAVKVLKHTYLGPAADRLVRVYIGANRRISDSAYTRDEDSLAPAGAGDAWEPEQQEGSRVPF